MFCSLSFKGRELTEKVQSFIPFLHAVMSSYEKTLDLHNVYENVHPRAIALSSLHSVNRAISSSLKLEELIPKIGRLCAQIVKVKYCSILLVDESRKWLIPKFMLDPSGHDTNRKRFAMGKGFYGHIAETGDFHIKRNCISLPLIDDDVIGVVTVKKKIAKDPFTRSDVEVLRALSEQAVVAIRNSQLLEEHERITLGSIKSINNIFDINVPRERLYTHVFSHIVYELAKALGLENNDLLNIQRAASLLDSGHLCVPESILSKKGKLTKREFDIVKEHPFHGVEIIQSIDSLKLVIPIILYHHERYDGKGYPEGLKKDEIPMGARIISLVAAFIAMTTDRPYRKARSYKEALQEIKKTSGTQFDPRVVSVFLQLMKQEKMVKIVKG